MDNFKVDSRYIEATGDFLAGFILFQIVRIINEHESACTKADGKRWLFIPPYDWEASYKIGRTEYLRAVENLQRMGFIMTKGENMIRPNYKEIARKVRHA